MALMRGETGSAFEVDDGASLHMAVKGLREENITQGLLHDSVAKELQMNVAEPFEKWAASHKVCDHFVLRDLAA